MKEFMMIFRHAPNQEYSPSPEEIEASMKQWQDWIGGIAAQGKFQSTNRLGFEGKTLSPDQVITDGPYAEVKEIVGGYMIVKGENIDEVMEMAKGCPALQMGSNVEVRDIMDLG